MGPTLRHEVSFKPSYTFTKLHGVRTNRIILLIIDLLSVSFVPEEGKCLYQKNVF
jgi:hypothetical protein